MEKPKDCPFGRTAHPCLCKTYDAWMEEVKQVSDQLSKMQLELMKRCFEILELIDELTDKKK